MALDLEGTIKKNIQAAFDALVTAGSVAYCSYYGRDDEAAYSAAKASSTNKAALMVQMAAAQPGYGHGYYIKRFQVRVDAYLYFDGDPSSVSKATARQKIAETRQLIDNTMFADRTWSNKAALTEYDADSTFYEPDIGFENEVLVVRFYTVEFHHWSNDAINPC